MSGWGFSDSYIDFGLRARWCGAFGERSVAKVNFSIFEDVKK
jgi:hypothetical protein